MRHGFQVGTINHREPWDSVQPAARDRVVPVPPGRARLLTEARWPAAGAGCRRWYATARCTKGRCWPVSLSATLAARAPPPPAEAEPGTECLQASRSRVAREPALQYRPGHRVWPFSARGRRSDGAARLRLLSTDS